MSRLQLLPQTWRRASARGERVERATTVRPRGLAHCGRDPGLPRARRLLERGLLERGLLERRLLERGRAWVGPGLVAEFKARLWHGSGGIHGAHGSGL